MRAMRTAFPAATGMALALAGALRAAQPAAPAAGGETPTPVIVELFTSQGCSSCPPADDLLRALERNQPVADALIIPLSEHVDYWNRLGWRDPFSSGQFSARQRVYVQALGAEHLYTPMMVVDGRTAFVGSRPIAAREAIVAARKAPKAALAFEATRVAEATVGIAGVVERAPPTTEAPDVWVAVTESPLATEVTRGENAARTLTHTGVVRSLTWLGSLPRPARASYPVEGRVRLRPTWRREHLRLVVFLQEPTSRRILGAAQLPLG